VYPPAGGNGAVDPPNETQPFFGFDDVGGDPGFNANPEFDSDTDLSGTNSAGDDWATVCDPAIASCGTPATDPTSDPVFAAATFDLAQAPEPAAVILVGARLTGLGLMRRKRRG
jgi:hypothetical protein